MGQSEAAAQAGSVGQADWTQVREEAAVAGVVEGPWSSRVSATPKGTLPGPHSSHES